MSKNAPGVRYAEVDRETEETRIHVVLDLDGGTRCDVKTGVSFFDHMLHQFAYHGALDLGVEAEGDVEVDDHHSVEDIGIAIGRALREALGDMESITRYGHAITPMDEALVMVVVDVSGRGGLFLDLPFKREAIGDLALENVREFLVALANNAGMTLHVRKMAGENDHHVCEATFKALGQALRNAVIRTERRGVPSTKGTLG